MWTCRIPLVCVFMVLTLHGIVAKEPDRYVVLNYRMITSIGAGKEWMGLSGRFFEIGILLAGYSSSVYNLTFIMPGMQFITRKCLNSNKSNTFCTWRKGMGLYAYVVYEFQSSRIVPGLIFCPLIISWNHATGNKGIVEISLDLLPVMVPWLPYYFAPVIHGENLPFYIPLWLPVHIRYRLPLRKSGFQGLRDR